MAAKWVKAIKPITRYAIDGAYRTYQPGDWFEANNQEIRLLVEQRKIEITHRVTRSELLEENCAIVITGGDTKRAIEYVRPYTANVYQDAPHFPTGMLYCLWWDAMAPLRLDLMPLGFNRIAAGWQMAAPLWRYGILARDIGTDESRQRTEEVIRDLRVPVFDTRMIFARKDSQTVRLRNLWMQERETGDDDKLCFMRALYQVKPILCALPVTWVSNSGR